MGQFASIAAIFLVHIHIYLSTEGDRIWHHRNCTRSGPIYPCLLLLFLFYPMPLHCTGQCWTVAFLQLCTRTLSPSAIWHSCVGLLWWSMCSASPSEELGHQSINIASSIKSRLQQLSRHKMIIVLSYGRFLLDLYFLTVLKDLLYIFDLSVLKDLVYIFTFLSWSVCAGKLPYISCYPCYHEVSCCQSELCLALKGLI